MGFHLRARSANFVRHTAFSNLKKSILATYINERIFAIIGSFVKPLGVLESLERLLRKLACGDYKVNHKSSVNSKQGCDWCASPSAEMFVTTFDIGFSRTVTLFTVSLPTNTVD